jgi:hypothetical protein
MHAMLSRWTVVMRAARALLCVSRVMAMDLMASGIMALHFKVRRGQRGRLQENTQAERV